MAKIYFWIFAGLNAVFCYIGVLDILPYKDGIGEKYFWMTLAFLALGYLAGIYERMKKGQDENEFLSKQLADIRALMIDKDWWKKIDKEVRESK